MTTYFVAKNGDDSNEGTIGAPFRSINHAAGVAVAGDIVNVRAGTYRESINPLNGGKGDNSRIVYQGYLNEKPILKGSEVVNHWELVEKNVWKATVENSLFGSYNPFSDLLHGDWLEQGNGCHAGDVFINGKSLYEAHSLKQLKSGIEVEQVTEYVTDKAVEHPHACDSRIRWYSKVDNISTTIYIYVPKIDPNRELIEISVRESCVYPTKTGINYLTFQGFEVCQAATPWAPPTTEQIGMINTHWAKGWLIQNNILHDAKCSAISLGTPKLEDDNAYSNRRDKPGYQYQLERVFNAERAGWTKELVGSHRIFNNTIFNCGQCAIVGNLGGAFSQINGNHISEIGTKYEFSGWEIAAIKLHAPIDTEVCHNYIERCVLGTWIDWQGQGTVIGENLYENNIRDLLIEMCHGPILVKNNIFTSKHSIDEYAQGVAFVNNLILGMNCIQSVLNRATPYHVPHDTQIKGYAMVYGGDDRYYNNIFLGDLENVKESNGTSMYNGSPKTLKEYIQKIESRMPGDIELFETVRQPVYIENNVYLNGAQAFIGEKNKLVDNNNKWSYQIEVTKSQVILRLQLPQLFDDLKGLTVNTQQLGKVRIADQFFEKSNGQKLNLCTDYFGNKKEKSVVGPIEDLHAGDNELVIWQDG